jgi:hypothetical protein
MSSQGFTVKFEGKAVCLITEGGYSVAGIFAGLGVSMHSLCK